MAGSVTAREREPRAVRKAPPAGVLSLSWGTEAAVGWNGGRHRGGERHPGDGGSEGQPEGLGISADLPGGLPRELVVPVEGRPVGALPLAILLHFDLGVRLAGQNRQGEGRRLEENQRPAAAD